MPAQLNHHIVHARDPEASARFLTEILGLPEPTRFGPFVVVQTANAVSLDFIGTDDERYLVPNPRTREPGSHRPTTTSGEPRSRSPLHGARSRPARRPSAQRASVGRRRSSQERA